MIVARNGVTYVQGARRRYPIAGLTWADDRVRCIDEHLAECWTFNPRHPDLDVLLDARAQVTTP